jgi:hypothetical protein
MAERLLLYYKYIREEKGLDGQVKLAQATKMPSTKAATEPDSPENIRRFRDAIKTLTGKDAPEL